MLDTVLNDLSLSGQTITLTDGGEIGNEAEIVDSTLNIEEGVVGNGLAAAGSEVNISGGVVGSGFDALSGSEINISGGEVGFSFDAFSGSEVNISGGEVGSSFDGLAGSVVNLSGGSLGDFASASTGTVYNVSGGELGDRFVAGGGSEINISGGVVGNEFLALPGSEINISGGEVGNDFEALSSSVVNLSGGAIGDNFIARDGSEINISGGEIGANFDVFSGAEVNLSVLEYEIDGVPQTSSSAGELVTITDRDVTLSGVFADGTAFSFILNSENAWSKSFFSDDATVTVTLVVDTAVGDTTGVALAQVNDFFNSASQSGGFIATFEYTISEASMVGDGVSAWTFESGYDGPGQVTNAYVSGFNGATSQSNGAMTVGNVDAGFQPDLVVGDSFMISFQVDGAGFDADDFAPRFIDADPEPVDVDPGDLVITAAPTNDWGAGFVQNIEVENMGDQMVGNWALLLDVPEGDEFVLTNVWGATAERLENGDILFTGLSYNDDIASGSTINFGFQGDNATLDEVFIDDFDLTFVQI